jgi:hypothetical protein
VTRIVLVVALATSLLAAIAVAVLAASR